MKKNRISDLTLGEMELRRQASPIVRSLLSASDEVNANEFHQLIHQITVALQGIATVSAHHETLGKFLVKFDASFSLWKQLLQEFDIIPNYDNAIMDLLHIGMWYADYANDPDGKLTPFGPTLSLLGNLMEHQPIGILHGLIQQVSGFGVENLIKAQALAVEMYQHFLKFADQNSISDLKTDKDDPPIIQLYSGGAVTWFKDFPIPTIIALSQSKAHEFGKLTALPHEFGHDISGTFQGSNLISAIEQRIRNLDIPHSDLWAMWTEEAFADAIGVSIIQEGEIYSLGNLFSNWYTNIILKDESGKGPDEHPNRHMRVLLAIEVGRILGLENTILNDMVSRWNAYSKSVNNHSIADHNHIFNLFSGEIYPVSEFEVGLQPVATTLTDTLYNELNGKSVKDIFADFESSLAAEMLSMVDKSKWID